MDDKSSCGREIAKMSRVAVSLVCYGGPQWSYKLSISRVACFPLVPEGALLVERNDKPVLDQGQVYWITGLAGSGKSTTATLLAHRLRARRPGVVLLDGDDLRAVYGDGLGHSIADRRILAMRNARLCQMLSNQGLDVVCATISLFHECHAWCRANIAHYHEIYLRVSVAELSKRDTGGLYESALPGRQPNVVGVDLPVEAPLRPDVIIDNMGQFTATDVVERVWNYIVAVNGRNIHAH